MSRNKKKTHKRLLPIEGEHGHTQCRVVIFFIFSTDLRMLVWHFYDSHKNSTEVNLGWTKVQFYSSILFFSDFKDCQHHESISLYNVHNYRALVQHWKVEQRHDSFLCRPLFFLFWLQLLLLSVTTDPLLLSNICAEVYFLAKGLPEVKCFFFF